MKDSHIKILTTLGILAIIFVFLVQVFWVRQAFTISESQFEHSVTVALRQVAEKVAQKNKSNFQQKNPVFKINPRLYVVEVNSEIDAELLDYHIFNIFNYFNIDQDVEYSIYSCQDNTMVYCNYIQKKTPQKIISIDPLPKFQGLDYYFSVSFPNYPLVSLNNIPMWMITSAVLVLVVLFFIYALFIVFNQKSITKIQRDFINNMTHEFKTPISTISVIQQVLSEENIHKNPTRIATYAKIIGDEINRLNMQVEKVLNITTLEKKEFQLNFQDIDVHEVIEQVLFTFQKTEYAKKVMFKTNLQAVNHTIPADKVHFTNVIYNIIENAIKYSLEEAHIAVNTKNEGQKLHISVVDKGKGISPKDIKKIFDKFYRVSQGNTHDAKGFGLGLFYVKQIIQAHKWNITVKSQEYQGSKFVITIPKTINRG
ncbi:MAG: HAMP domain-containing sensor histidine kinase [Saprospiraceae bacterium]